MELPRSGALHGAVEAVPVGERGEGVSPARLELLEKDVESCDVEG